MDGMGLAGGFAEAAQGVMSGFQYARQQQALEQQRKQQELESAEARADAKMKRELLMKEIAAKEKAREIYAMDPKKDFGIDPKDFPNREMYEASLSRHYAAEFRKAGIGEEAVKHESAGGQFYETGTKKVAKSAFAKALSGRTKEAQSDLEKIGFNVGEIKPVKAKDGSMAFQIIDNVDGKPTVLSTLSAAELAGVMGDEDTMISYLIQKDMQISKIHAELEAAIKRDRALNTGKTVDPAVKKMQDEALGEATIFRTKDGTQIIVGEDLKITKGLLERGHSLASINKMRQKSGLPEIELKSMSKDQFETAKGQYSGLGNEEKSSDSDIEAGSRWYGSLSQRGEGTSISGGSQGNTGRMGPTPQDQKTGSPELPQGWTTKEDYDKAEGEKKKQDQINKDNESRNWKSRRKPVEKFGMGVDWKNASTASTGGTVD